MRFRMGLMGAALLAGWIVSFAIAVTSVSSGGVIDASGVFGTALLGGALAPLLAVISIFAALVASNPKLSLRARRAWYVSLLLASPLALPSYWLLHVWPAPLLADESHS